MQKKSNGLLAVIGASWLALSIGSFRSFEWAIPHQYGPVAHIALLGFYAWFAAFWLWGLHNFWHQIFAWFPRFTHPQTGPAQPEAAVAIIYTTCDDFDPVACASALSQTHTRTRLVICDDSFQPASRSMIDEWAEAQERPVTVIRRADNKGFKAGNLNHAISKYIPEEYLLICDADEIIPADFVERLLPYFVDESVGFVQANHRARLESDTQFAATQAVAIDVYWSFFLPAKNRFGFVGFQGHGAVLRRSAWEKTKGFPEMMCEDLGWSSLALVEGYRGVFATNVMAEEATPATYKALLKQRTRVTAGSIEYFQRACLRLLKSPKATVPEKIDMVLTSSSCYMNLVMMVNLWGGLILSHLHRLQGFEQSSPWLPFLYVVGPIGSLAPVLYEILKQPKRYGQYLFTAASIYGSLMPMLCLTVIEQTLHLRAPIFHVTGKIARQRQRLLDYALSVPFGLAILIAAALLPSQVFPLMVGAALTFLLTPLMALTEKKGLLGMVGRQWGLAPYVAVVAIGIWPH